MRKLALLKSAFALIVVVTTLNSTVSAAFAQGKSDTFNRNTAPMTGGLSSSRPISGNAALGKNDPISRWFDDVDMAYFEYADIPTNMRTIISRPFGGDAKRCEEWSKTIGQVAQRYHAYAKTLRQTSVSRVGPAANDLQSYRDALANYYEDSAEYFEDWIRPRRPAVTREELKQQLDEMHDRQVALKTQIDDLNAIDQKLRTAYDVRGRDDALMRYVAKQPNK